MPGDGGRTRGNAPDARAVTRIVDRRQGHRQHLAWRLVVADAQGHGRPQRGIRQRAVQYIARFKGAGGGVSRVRKQAQGRRDRLRFAAIACRQRLAADRRAQRLRQLHPRFALPRPRQADHHLPGADHLPRLSEGFHHHAVSIRQQSGIAGGVLRHIGLRLGRAEVGSRRLCCRVNLVEFRGRDGAARHQAAIAGQIVGRLFGSRPRGIYGPLLGLRLQG